MSASALFHAVSRLSSVSDGTFVKSDVIRRSATSMMSYGSPFDGQSVVPFASLTHELDWIFESVCDAKSLADTYTYIYQYIYMYIYIYIHVYIYVYIYT